MLWALGSLALASTLDQVLEDLIAVEKGLREGDDAAAARAALLLRTDAATLDEELPNLIKARLMRAIGAGLYVAGEQEEGHAWLAAGFVRDPYHAWGAADLPAGHPLRDLDVSEPIPFDFPAWTENRDPKAKWRDPAQMAVERPYCVRQGAPEQKPYRLLWRYPPSMSLRTGRVRYAGLPVVHAPGGEPYRWICPPGWAPE